MGLLKSEKQPDTWGRDHNQIRLENAALAPYDCLGIKTYVKTPSEICVLSVPNSDHTEKPQMGSTAA